MQKTLHLQLTDQEFIEQFEQLKLNPEWFTHEAHLRMAWIYSSQQSLKQAISKACHGIQSFDDKFGDGTKYHLTVSRFLMELIFEREKRTKTRSFEDFKNSNLDLLTDFKGVLSRHYDFDVLNDTNAKTHYIAPNEPIF